MGEKDVAGKYLESFNDVFADIYNVLLFHEKVICEEKLQSAAGETMYKAEEGMERSQFRDVVKKYGEGRFAIACLGIENQTTIDSYMPVRVMGDDYGNYRRMIDNEEQFVPAITVVLNFSGRKWKIPLGLKDMMSIPKKWEPYVQDYRIHVFDVAELSAEVRNQFTSDFKIVADFFAEKNRDNYVPSKEKIKHVEAVLEMMRVFTNDPTYAKIKDEIVQWDKEGRDISMCTFADRMTKLGIEQERERSERVLRQERERGEKQLRQEREKNQKILAEKDNIIRELKLQLASLT